MYQRFLRGQSINKLIFTCKISSQNKIGFRKSHGTQYSLMTMLEKWKSALDKGENACVLFMDLSKVFDTINQDLFLSKLKA